jgi:beta-aspartyl-peptidase (threonine type)
MRRRDRHTGWLGLGLGLLLLLAGCAERPADAEGRPSNLQGRWALAIHGGAGVPRDSLDAEREAAYRTSLEAALRVGLETLEGGGRALDAVEAVVRSMEDDPLFNAGRGAVFNHNGINELDASIMDGATLACGGVTGVTTVKNPVSLARLVMEETPHVLLARKGAELFAESMGVELVEPAYFFTEERWDRLQEIKRREGEPGDTRGTVGAVALDRYGDLAAATSTGGLTNKMYGRVGDSPIVGAGTFADNTTCAVSGTGKGEEFIRHGVALTIAHLMQFRGLSVGEAADRVVHDVLQPGDGGVIAVDGQGNIVMTFNTPGMFRGAADDGGRFETAIWE